MVMSPEFPSSDKTKAEHAGQSGVPENVAEFGKVDYDNTNLQQAADNHLEVPGEDDHFTLKEGFKHAPLDNDEEARINALVEQRVAQRLDSERKPKKRWSLKTKLIAGASTVAALVAIGTGVKALTGDKEDEGSRLPTGTTSAPVTTGPSNEVSPTPAQTTEAPSPSATETASGVVQTAGEVDISGLESLKAAQFEKLGLDGMPLVTTTYSRISEQLSLNLVLNRPFVDGTSLVDYNPIVNTTDPRMGRPLNKFATGTTIVRQNRFAWQVASAMEKDMANGDGQSGFDKENALKMLTGVDLPGSESYKRDKDSLEHTSKVTEINIDDLNSYVATQSSNLFKYEYEGAQYDARKLRVQSNAGVFDVTYVFVPREELGETNGSTNGMWLEASKVVAKGPEVVAGQ